MPLFPLNLTVNGVPFTPLQFEDVLEITVDQSAHLPDMFTIRMIDEQAAIAGMLFKWTDNTVAFPIGGKVNIVGTGSVFEDPDNLPGALLPIGEITAVEPEFGEDGAATLVVRGYDLTHRLHRGKKTQTFMMMPDSLIWMSVCNLAGTPATVTPTGGPREYVIQNNQTDWDFIKTRARLYGYEMRKTELGTLMIGPREVPVDPTPALVTWGEDLFSFRPRVTASGQVSSVQVLGYDFKTKLPITTPFAPLPPTDGGAQAKLDFAAAKLFDPTAAAVVTTNPPDLAPDALSNAKGVASDITSRFVQAEGLCKGNPSIRAGGIVIVKGVGSRFSGKYMVTSARHVWKQDGEFVTEFSVTGSRPDTISDLIEDGMTNERMGRVQGVVIGQVSNNLDPMGLGRVKVRFPWLGMLPPVESNWARVATPWAGVLKSGAQFIPEINDEVLVAFEHGDPNRPYVIGSLFSPLQPPPEASAVIVKGGKVMKRTFKSSTGHMIVLDDTPGQMGITIQDLTGQNYIKLDTVKQAVEIKALNEVSIECATFKVKANALVQIDSMAATKISGNAALELITKGAGKLNANANLDIKGAMMVSVKTAAGGIVVQGPQVNINNGALEII